MLIAVYDYSMCTLCTYCTVFFMKVNKTCKATSLNAVISLVVEYVMLASCVAGTLKSTVGRN